MRSKIRPIRAIKFHKSRPIFRNNSYTNTNIISNFSHVKMSVFLSRPGLALLLAPHPAGTARHPLKLEPHMPPQH